MSKWTTIKCDYFNVFEGKYHVDACSPSNDDVEVIAKIDREGTVEYLDEDARTDEEAQSVIKEFSRKKRSNYEAYADAMQKMLVEKTTPLKKCIAQLKTNKEIFSENYLDAQIDLVASLFGLTSGEIKRAIEGQEYWCV